MAASIRQLSCYWGKAAPTSDSGPVWHPLAYHCLDVAAVAAFWWEQSPSLRHAFLAALKIPRDDGAAASRLRAWVLFLVAVHDLGKLDVRFQSKAPDALRQSWPELDLAKLSLTRADRDQYRHGEAGYGWFIREYVALLGLEDSDDDLLNAWQPWIGAVTGHHGAMVSDAKVSAPSAAQEIVRHDAEARREWFQALADLFLKPAGLRLSDEPPECGVAAQALLAGFCSVADWLGSNSDVFQYDTGVADLHDYFRRRCELTQQEGVLEKAGLVNRCAPYDGIGAVLPPGKPARQIQTLVDGLPCFSGLTIVEAPTGSGKTEAALAYAWRLLAEEVADSIVFALPTQATANAMLGRISEFAARLYPQGGPNVVLAHGRSRYNPEFIGLQEASGKATVQGREDARAQCAAWLAQSRKRVFLGQIGVCTVDQVLLSVLPIRHKFVRGFALNKSVLVVDEVHAYDTYMHGLLHEVLRRQSAVGGSAILLSATLSSGQRADLLSAWGATSTRNDDPYPLITQATSSGVARCGLPSECRPPERTVEIECLSCDDALPGDALIARLLDAARAGARIAVICNLVDVAQRLARHLEGRTDLPIDVFHARYRFRDRQEKESEVLKHYGKDAARGTGRILVATQVVEQSLDLDFDWMVTQICPVDLLFQRLGRLHRHERARPSGFETPRCTVLTGDGSDYGLHEVIYGNARVLWRTEQLLRRAEGGKVVFPEAYREWIEAVYQRDDWADEPEKVYLQYDCFSALQEERHRRAQRLVRMTMSQLADEETKAASLTRDGEMSLSVLPVMEGVDGKSFLDGTAIASLEEGRRDEELNLNTVAVPRTWDKLLKGCERDEEGRLILELSPQEAGGWWGSVGSVAFRYSSRFGLEKSQSEPPP